MRYKEPEKCDAWELSKGYASKREQSTVPVFNRKGKTMTENFIELSNAKAPKLNYTYLEETIFSFVFVRCLLNLGTPEYSEGASTQMLCSDLLENVYCCYIYNEESCLNTF